MIAKASERHHTGKGLVFGYVQGFGPLLHGFFASAHGVTSFSVSFISRSSDTIPPAGATFRVMLTVFPSVMVYIHLVQHRKRADGHGQAVSG